MTANVGGRFPLTRPFLSPPAQTAVSRGVESLDPTRGETIFLLLEYLDMGDLQHHLYVHLLF